MIHNRFIEVARAVALSSLGTGPNSQFRLGSVLVYKKRIISSGVNSHHTDRKMLKFYPYPFVHAESAAIFKRGLDNCYGCVLYSCRVKKDGTIALSKPCQFCSDLIKEVGIKRVVYSISENEYGEIKV